jgi:hypothetical protein
MEKGYLTVVPSYGHCSIADSFSHRELSLVDSIPVFCYSVPLTQLLDSEQSF